MDGTPTANIPWCRFPVPSLRSIVPSSVYFRMFFRTLCFCKTFRGVLKSGLPPGESVQMFSYSVDCIMIYAGIQFVKTENEQGGKAKP
jgi:hypothetical protein